MRKEKSNVEVFFWPLIIGALSIIGLISALVADNVWDALSWLTLSIPVGVSAISLQRKT